MRLPLPTIPLSSAHSLTDHVPSVKMLRDRYKKWNINDKNCKNRPRRRAAAAPRGLTTQMALRQSPRIVELEDDESHFAQDLAGPQNESGVLDQQMLLADLRTGSLHAALASLDPTFHEIMNGLSDWCDAWVNFPFTPDGTNSGAALKAVILESIPMRELSRAESLQAWRRLVDACSIEVMLVGLRDTDLLAGLLILIIFTQPMLHTSPIPGMLRFLHQHSVQILGPRHPVTLLTNWSTPPRLPSKPLQDIVEGLFQIGSHRLSIIHHRRMIGRLPSGSSSGLTYPFKFLSIQVLMHGCSYMAC